MYGTFEEVTIEGMTMDETREHWAVVEGWIDEWIETYDEDEV